MSMSLLDKPLQLKNFYKNFKVSQKILLTGHSHQAWPDCAFDGYKEAWEDASNLIDQKWGKVFAKSERVINGYKKLLGNDESGFYTLAASTHDVLIKFFSSLDYKKRPKIVTTTGEFHTLNRQLRRLEEEGVQVEWVAVDPIDSLAERMASKIDSQTSAVLASAVFFESSLILPNLKSIQEAADRHGSNFLVDVYHALNVVPFDLKSLGLENSFLVGGGYKYCQLGEGNCFLRFPKHYKGRPVFTGWFADFSHLANKKTEINYANDGMRFAGATFDPISFYRAAQVFDFFERENLTPNVLRELNQAQTKYFIDKFLALDISEEIIGLAHHVSPEKRAGFVSLHTRQAEDLHKKLLQANVWTDYRGEYLRFGPAPYVSFSQIDEAIKVLKSVL